MGVLGQVECHQPVQGIPLALVVLVKSPISWSEDNNIAIVTQHGTYIFDLHITSEECSPGLMFNRNFIAPPKEVNKVDTEVSVSSLIDHAERADVHNIILDETLSSMQRAKIENDPKLSKSTCPALPGGDPNHIGYRRGVWSPRGIAKHERCILCLVTHDNQVMLVGRKKLFWREMVNISKIWHSYVTDNKWSMLKMKWNTSAYEKHSSHIKMLSIAEILWSPLYDADTSSGFSVLIMTLANGKAVFWRVSANLDQQEQQEYEKGIEMMSVEDLKLEKISSMHWLQGEGHSGFLTVGNCHGQVKMFEIQFSKTKVSIKDYGFAYEEEDNLIVNHIHLDKSEEEETIPHKGNILMVVAKHNVLLALVIQITNGAISVQNTTFKRVSRLAITGMVYINPAYVYISVKDGAVHHASIINKDKGELSIVVHEPVFQSEGSAYTGFMTSPNKTLWGILESISVAYDHLIIREPTQINFYQVGKPTTILSHLRNSPLPLYQNVDALESLRISILKYEDTDLPMISVEDSKKLSANQKKLEHWVLRMLRAVGYRKQEAKDMEDLEKLVCQSIIEENVIGILKDHAAKGKISAEMSLSLSIMCKWFRRQKLYTALIKSVLPKLEESETEKCLVCATTIEMTSLTIETCSAGHKIPRCPRTLLLTRPTVQCPRCRVFSNDHIKNPESGVMSRCLFCDGFLLRLIKRRTEK